MSPTGHSRRGAAPIDEATVEGFGREWARFDQRPRSRDELERTFSQYFSLFPWSSLSADAVGMDLGCGTGRWARFVAERVGSVVCVDPSGPALDVAIRNLRDQQNCRFLRAAAGELPMREECLDFGYSLGVLHHVPHPVTALTDAVSKLKPGAPFLVYLYYALDNRPAWFRLAWKTSDVLRRWMSRLPPRLRYALSQVVAATVYLPMARTARVLERRGRNVDSIPLSAYRDRGFYAMRTDALDRLGTPVEKRFTATEVRETMQLAGLTRVEVSTGMPYWCAIGYRDRPGGSTERTGG